jgi:hypothetical protein
VGKLTSCLLQILLLWLLVVLHKLSRKSADAITVLVSLLWALFVVHRVWYYNEQIIKILSCSLVGISVCCYQWYTGTHPLLLMTVLQCYGLALWIWWDFEAIMDQSVDSFYYHTQWCGLSETPSTSCSWFSCASSNPPLLYPARLLRCGRSKNLSKKEQESFKKGARIFQKHIMQAESMHPKSLPTLVG